MVALQAATADQAVVAAVSQAAAAARMAATEVAEEWQLDIVEAATKVAKESREAWDEDVASEVEWYESMGYESLVKERTDEKVVIVVAPPE